MSETPKRILVDTNVWLDYFIPSRRGRSVAIEFLRDACTAQVDLLYAATSSKDLFYLISSEHKAWYRREHGSLSQYAAAAARLTFSPAARYSVVAVSAISSLTAS